VAESAGVRDVSEASGMAIRPCTELAVAPKQSSNFIVLPPCLINFGIVKTGYSGFIVRFFQAC
jgi:hypothetical protein